MRAAMEAVDFIRIFESIRCVYQDASPGLVDTVASYEAKWAQANAMALFSFRGQLQAVGCVNLSDEVLMGLLLEAARWTPIRGANFFECFSGEERATIMAGGDVYRPWLGVLPGDVDWDGLLGRWVLVQDCWRYDPSSPWMSPSSARVGRGRAPASYEPTLQPLFVRP